MSYGQKSDFQDGGRRHLEYLKFSIFGHMTTACTYYMYRISSKSDDYSLTLWRFNDLQNGGGPPSWILNICRFCHLALVDMPFCFLIQNFAEIRQLVDELWPKKRFSRWRPPPS